MSVPGPPNHNKTGEREIQVNRYSHHIEYSLQAQEIWSLPGLYEPYQSQLHGICFSVHVPTSVFHSKIWCQASMLLVP